MPQPKVIFYKTTYDTADNSLNNDTNIVNGGVIQASDPDGIASPRLYIKDGDTVSTVGESLQEIHINTKSKYNDGSNTHKNEWAITDHIEGTSKFYLDNSGSISESTTPNLFYKVFINKDLNTAEYDTNILEIKKYTKSGNTWSSISPLVIKPNGTIFCNDINSGNILANNITAAHDITAVGDISANQLGCTNTTCESITGTIDTPIGGVKALNLNSIINNTVDYSLYPSMNMDRGVIQLKNTSGIGVTGASGIGGCGICFQRPSSSDQSGAIIPYSQGGYGVDLGTPSYKFNNVYANNLEIYEHNISFTGTTTAYLGYAFRINLTIYNNSNSQLTSVDNLKAALGNNIRHECSGIVIYANLYASESNTIYPDYSRIIRSINVQDGEIFIHSVMMNVTSYTAGETPIVSLDSKVLDVTNKLTGVGRLDNNFSYDVSDEIRQIR